MHEVAALTPNPTPNPNPNPNRVVRGVAAVDVGGAQVDWRAMLHVHRVYPAAHALPRLEHHRVEAALLLGARLGLGRVRVREGEG